MLRKKLERVEWLESRNLADLKGCKHGFFLRYGGISKDLYGSLNFSTSAGDRPVHVVENLLRAQRIIAAPLITNHQVHGDAVRIIKEGDEIDLDTQKKDALITNRSDIALGVMYADCQGALVYDPIKRVVAAIHAGWRGQTLSIYSKVAETMATEFGSKPKDLVVSLSPSLGPTKAQFVNYKREFPIHMWKYKTQNNNFDLWSLAVDEWQEAGVKRENIESANHCTYSDDCFSYRRDGKSSGRHLAFIKLR